mmetsp:Transcript_28187/g.70760  ORF Transcript_28187/g.70760 Transcript_28187/m.70760 type:complete len:1006 (-) Transcript_28187:79-3096(-)
MLCPVAEVKKKKKITPGGDSQVKVEKAEKVELISRSPDYRPPPAEVRRDTAITGMQWEVEELKYIWMQTLHILKKVNTISSPAIHAEAILTLCETINILLHAEMSCPYDQAIDPARPAPVNLMNVFGPWLFEACSLSDAYVQGKATAYGTLCRMVIRHHHTVLPQSLLNHFYAILHEGLTTSTNVLVTHEILKHSSNIFNTGLEGCNVLIPAYLREIKKVLGSDSLAGGVPQEVRMRAITILGSLICYSSHLEGVTIPSQGPEKEMKFSELRGRIAAIVSDTLHNDPLPYHKTMCVWCLTVVLFEELNQPAPDVPLITNVMKALLGYTVHTDRHVARASLDALSSQALVVSEITRVEPQVCKTVVMGLCATIINQLQEQNNNKSFSLQQSVVADHYYCLMDWLSYATNLLDDTNVASKVFCAIEMGLLGLKVDQGTQLPNSTPDIKDKDGKKDKEKKKRLATTTNGSPQEKTEVLRDIMEAYRLAPTHSSDAIRDAAENLLLHLLNFYHHFPCREGVEIFNSLVSETDDVEDQGEQYAQTYVYNDTILFSVVEVPTTEGAMARIIVRDASGKYAWDSSLTYDLPRNAPIEPPRCLINLENVVEPASTRKITQGPGYERAPTEPPVFSADNPAQETVDFTEELLKYLTNNWEDCLTDAQPLNMPAELPPEFTKHFKTVEESLLDQDIRDLGHIEAWKQNKPPSDTWACKPPEPPVPLSPFQQCRLLLAHLGFLSQDRHDVYLTEISSRCARSIAQLDKTCGREMMKIGIIYVKEGQEGQKTILKNEEKSPLFREFVDGLGWKIDVATHRGYLGGLDPKLTTGATAPYFASYNYEVIFHDITSMPTNPADEQQIHKKRHVGNDIVHIVYSEHLRDYNPQTITSQFNDAHIVVYPLKNGLYRVNVFEKENVPLIGPLLHGMTMPKRLVPMLVRLSAINANRYVRFQTEGYTRPFTARKRAIEELVKRYKVSKSYEELLVDTILRQRVPVDAVKPSPSASQPIITSSGS